MCDRSVTELDLIRSALSHCAELREVTFNYDRIGYHDDPNVWNAIKHKLPTLLDVVKNKRYLNVLEFRGRQSEEEYSKGRFKYYVISKVQSVCAAPPPLS